jgi:hypothetical protein
LEGQLIDQKSLRAVTGKTADWNEIAKDCIAFANATGGRLLLGSRMVRASLQPISAFPQTCLTHYVANWQSAQST